MTTLESITKELKQRCAGAGLSFVVASDGNVNATLAIVGEAPGVREVEIGRPFVGGSGNYLWDCLRAIGINRTQVYISNVVKRQVSFALKGNDRVSVNRSELAHWCGLMKWELAQLPNLQHVLVLGNYALLALLGEDGITNWRGSVVEVDIAGRKVKVICANNPAMILREPKLSPIFRFDINKVKRVIDGKFNPTKVTSHINPTLDDAISWIRKMRKDGLPVGYDIETISKQTACHGFANTIDEGMCINLRNRTANRFTLEQECILYREIEGLLSDESVQFVAQNGAFDCGWVYFKDRIRVHKVWFDTMLGHHTLYPQLPHSLAFIVAQYTDNPYYKDEGKAWKEGGDIDTFWRYNVKDCCHMLEAQRLMLSELRQQQLEDFFFNKVMKRQPHLVRMTVMGCKADVDLKAKLNNDLGEDVNNTLDAFHKQAQLCTGKDKDFLPNPDSTPQMRMLLFNDLRLVGRGVSVDKENRQRMYEHPHTNAECKKLLDIYNKYKKDSKFLSTYVNMSLDNDNRFRTEYKQTGVQAAPGRLSSTETAWGSGCVPGTTEVLTRQGWEEIQNVDPREPIAVWEGEGITFRTPTSYVKLDVEGSMLEYVGEQFRGSFTPNHRMLLHGSRGNLFIRNASECRDLVYTRMPVSGYLGGGHKHNPEYLRRLAMYSADGTRDGERNRVVVHKARKVARAHQVLQDVEFWVTTNARGYTIFNWKENSMHKELQFSDILEYDQESLDAFIDEVGNWDAHRRGGSYQFYTTIKKNAEIVQTVAHLTGRSASMNVDLTNSNEYGNTSTKPLYIVNVKPRKTVCVEKKNWIESKCETDKVYCPELGDRPWLMRYKGSISITLNSNLQNIPQRAYPMFVADQGYEFNYFDLSGAEARVVAHLANIKSWIEDFHKADTLGKDLFDVHRSTASQVFGIPYEEIPMFDRWELGKNTDDPKLDGEPTLRFLGKKCKHGLNYRMQPQKLADTCEISLKLAAQAYAAYHRAYPEIRQWWDATIAEVRKTKCLWTPEGRRLIILGRLDDDEALESIIAFRPQSTIGDFVSDCIHLIENDRFFPRENARVLLNIHDALIIINKIGYGEQVRRVIKRVAERPIIINGTPVIIPVEMKVSKPDEHGVHRWSTLKAV